MQDDRLLVDAKEAARMLCLSRRTLEQMTRTGAVPSIKLGALRRYRIETLRNWLAAKEAEHAKP